MKLYIADYEKLNIPGEYEKYLSVLPAESVERINGKKQEQAKYLALMRELMVQLVLRREAEASGWGPCGTSDRGSKTTVGEALPLQMKKGEHGKPFLDPPCPNFDFNLSHSGSMVILGIASGPIGVDVEKTKRAYLNIEGMMRHFTEREALRIRRALNKEAEFYRIWTYREAFSKETGFGLAIFGKEEIDIDYRQRSIRHEGRNLKIWEYSMPGYQIAVCTDGSEGKPEVQMIRETDMIR